MIKKLTRTFKYLTPKSRNKKPKTETSSEIEKIPDSIKDIKKKLKEIFSGCSDFVLREVMLGNEKQVKIMIAYIDGLANKEWINTDILKPVLTESRIADLKKDFNASSAVEILKQHLLSVSELEEIEDFNQSIDFILSGETVIYVDGSKLALKAGTRGWEMRAIEEPGTETVVRGPREGFTETLRINTSLIRRRVKNPNLKFESMKIGQQTKTDVCICYIKGLANEEIVERVRRRLKNINIDGVLSSGYIEQFIEDAPLSIFPTVGNSEKPDKVAGKLLEGRVAILCDGTPFVLTVPYLFIETIQSSEDYYSRPYFASILRLLRLTALLVSTTLPALYVALITFHYNVIPFKLMLTMAASREGIPFSAFSETLVMLLSLELLREAGLRLPKAIGQAISIVGGLILGDAAVKAGLASNPIVIVVATTAISSFIIPPLEETVAIVRMLLLVSANILGLLGIVLVEIALLIHMCKLESFGVSYMAPFAPLYGADLKDTLIRAPLWAMLTRPRPLSGKDSFRMKADFEMEMKENKP